MRVALERVFFHTIDLSRDAAAAVAFRRDAHVCSFGSDEGFDEPQYLAWLAERIAQAPDLIELPITASSEAGGRV